MTEHEREPIRMRMDENGVFQLAGETVEMDKAEFDELVRQFNDYKTLIAKLNDQIKYYKADAEHWRRRAEGK